MNINYYVKCEVCGSIIQTKIQAGWLKHHPIAIYCGKCNILIDGEVFQKPQVGEIRADFRNAKILYDLDKEKVDFLIESSGEFTTMKMVSADSREAMISMIMPPFIRNCHNVNMDLFKKNVLGYLNKKINEWPKYRRIFELWNNKNSIYLEQELRKVLSTKQDKIGNGYINKGLHTIFLKQSDVMTNDKSTYKKFSEIHSELSKLNDKNLTQLNNRLNRNEYLNNCKRKVYECLDRFVDIFMYLIPAYGVMLFNQSEKSVEFGITTVSFERLKQFYIDCYELLGEMAPIINGLNNLAHRGNFELCDERVKIKYDDLFYKPNSLKIKTINQSEKFSTLISIFFDNGLRNSIGHFDYYFNGYDQLIQYEKNTQHDIKNVTYKNGIYLLEFACKCLKMYKTIIYVEDIIYCIETRDFNNYVQSESMNEIVSIENKEKVGRNDPCPCGSGKKFKKCCIDKF